MAKSQLFDKIVQRIAADYSRLTLVSNPDGFLALDFVCYQLYSEYGIVIVTGSQLDHRLHFELEYKANTDKRYIYLCDHPDRLLPDMRAEAPVIRFNVSDLFPLFQDKAVLNQLCMSSPELLDKLYDKCVGRRVKMAEGQAMVMEIIRQADKEYANSAESFQKRMACFTMSEWKHDAGTIMELSSQIAEGIEKCLDGSLEAALPLVNQHFQKWIDDNYFSLQNSSAVLAPKCVNKILPYLSSAYKQDDKVALLVVDGLSYWQYAILHRHLAKAGLQTDNQAIVSWLPSITMLSRQAIFRGDTPLQDYKQNPTNEATLWKKHWEGQGFAAPEIQYLYLGHDEFAINEGVKRLALVTVEMDDKMHAVAEYGELALLTNYWASHIIEKIRTVLRMGFHLYLTTDHGSVRSKGWRALTQTEKVFLYADGSRGTRHLIYKNKKEQQLFYEDVKDALPLLQHDNWLAIRNDMCFAASYNTGITHGGSHFMEVVIPWIRISE